MKLAGTVIHTCDFNYFDKHYITQNNIHVQKMYSIHVHAHFFSWIMWTITYLSELGPIKGLCPDIPAMLIWSFIIIISPLLKSGFIPPAALVTMSISTPNSFITLIGIVTCPINTLHNK